MLSIRAVFENSLGRKHRWTIHDVGEVKSPEALRITLEKLTILNIYERNGVNLFQKVISATQIETFETILFENGGVPDSQAEELEESEEEVAYTDLQELSEYLGPEVKGEQTSEELQSFVNENGPAGFVFEGFIDEESEETVVEAVETKPVAKKKTKNKFTKTERRLMKQFGHRG